MGIASAFGFLYIMSYENSKNCPKNFKKFIFTKNLKKKKMLNFFQIRRHFRIRMVVIVIEILKCPTLFS